MTIEASAAKTFTGRDDMLDHMRAVRKRLGMLAPQPSVYVRPLALPAPPPKSVLPPPMPDPLLPPVLASVLTLKNSSRFEIETSQPSNVKITVAVIIETVAKAALLPVSAMTGHRRAKELVAARFVAYALCTTHTHLTAANIGRHFGDRDHSTILHGLDCVAAKPRRYAALLAKAEAILKQRGASHG